MGWYLHLAETDSESSLKAWSPRGVPSVMFTSVYLISVYPQRTMTQLLHGHCPTGPWDEYHGVGST